MQSSEQSSEVCCRLYLQVSVEYPTEYTTVWIVRDRLEYPAPGFILTSVNKTTTTFSTNDNSVYHQ